MGIFTNIFKRRQATSPETLAADASILLVLSKGTPSAFAVTLSIDEKSFEKIGRSKQILTQLISKIDTRIKAREFDDPRQGLFLPAEIFGDDALRVSQEFVDDGMRFVMCQDSTKAIFGWNRPELD